MISISNPYYGDNKSNLLHDDVFTLAGITASGPGLGRQVREVLAGLFRDIMDKHGPRAFELPKRAAAIHEAGHVVINSVLGTRTTSVLIDHMQVGEQCGWIGFTDVSGGAFVYTPDKPATFDELLARSRTIYAGIAAEALFAGEDRREGSSLDEVLLSQLFGRYAADLIGEDPELFWQRNVHVWCLCQLGPCRDHRGVAPAQAGQRQAAAAAVRPGGARGLPGAGEQLAMASSRSWLQASGRSLLPT